MIPKEVLDSFKGKHILVTGGTGLIGRQVVNILLEAGAIVWTASLDKHNLFPLKAVHLTMDLTDITNCLVATNSVDYVFHLAGLKGSPIATQQRAADYFVPIVMLNTNVLEACRRNGVKKVVYTSSIGAYAPGVLLNEKDGWVGFPMDLYPGWAKRMGEIQLAAYKVQYGLEWTTVRLCNVYGPGPVDIDGMVVSALFAKILRGDDPVEIWGDGSPVRDFLFSRDAAEGIILAMYHDIDFVNIGSGNGYSIKELVETMCQVVPFNYVFNPSKPNGYLRRVLDIRLAQERLGFVPTTSLYDGLKETWDWLKGGKNANREN